ncbi:putative reverse transcriptase domain-containing protein [Tanacetum coccineum]
MDPNSSLEKNCLGDDVVIISSDKVEGSRDWNSPKYQDTAGSKGKKVINALSFYRMETDEISEWYIEPCFVNGLEAYDGEINLAFDEILISNEFLYFVKFIINPEEDDFEPRVILGRSFLRLAKGVVDFGNGVTTIYPEPDPFEDDYEKTGKSSDDWEQLFDFNFDDVPKPYSSARGHLTQEEVAKEALAIRITQKFSLLEGKVNENALADTGSDINTMPYRIYETLGREEIKKIDRGIIMINHTHAEAIGKLSNVLCQVGVTTIIAKFLILDIPIDHDAPIVVGRGFLIRWVAYLTPQKEFSQPLMESVIKPSEAQDSMLCEARSDEEIFTLVAWIRAFNINEPIYAELCHELGLYQAVELEEEGFNVYFERGLRNDDNFNEPNFEGDPQNDHLWFVSKDDWYDKIQERNDCGILKERYKPTGSCSAVYDRYLSRVSELLVPASALTSYQYAVGMTESSIDDGTKLVV